MLEEEPRNCVQTEMSKLQCPTESPYRCGTGTNSFEQVQFCGLGKNEHVRFHGIRIALSALSRNKYELAPELPIDFGANII